MRRNKFTAAASFSLGAFALATLSLAAPPADILAPAVGFKPTLNLADSYSEKLVTIPSPPPEPGEPREPATREQVVKPQKISAKVLANIEGFDFVEIQDTMPIELTVGGFTFAGSLGECSEAIKNNGFPAGGVKATFPFVGSFEKPNGDILERQIGSVIFSWTAKRLTVILKASDVAAAGLAEIAASNYLGLYQDPTDEGTRPSGSATFSNEPIEVGVKFGSAQGTGTALAKGKSTSTLKRFGSDAAGTLEEFLLGSVSLTGKAAP